MLDYAVISCFFFLENAPGFFIYRACGAKAYLKMMLKYDQHQVQGEDKNQVEDQPEVDVHIQVDV